MSASLRSEMPMSSRPSRKRSCVAGSSGNSASSPAAGADTVRRSTSTVISSEGSAFTAASSWSTNSAGTCAGTSPFLVQLLRKMSAKRGEMTTSKP
jgi:hypothetical protein